MKRREFITLLGGATAAAWPVMARAQHPKRIGVLDLGNVDAQSFRTELREGLRKSGYIEGQNIEYAFRSGNETLPSPSSRPSWLRSRSMSSWRSTHPVR